MPDQWPRWQVYAISLMLVAVTLIIRLNVQELFESRPLLIIFILPIILSAYLGGLGPGVVSTLSAAVGIKYFLIPPSHSYQFAKIDDLMQLSALIIAGLFISALNEALHSLRRKLDQRVQERTAELARVNETLAASRARFEAIFNSMGDAAVFTEPERQIALVNPAMEAMFGYPAEDLLGRGTEILYADPEDYDKQGRARYNPEAATGGQASFDIKYRRQDGTVFDAESVGMPVKDVHGHLLGFVGLHRDVTGRKRAEEALRESEARLDLALRSSEMGVWYLDLVENKRFFDDQVCHLLGLDPAKFTGKAEEFFNAVHPQDRAAIKSALARSIEHGAPYETEYRTIWPDGSIHHITARGKLIYDKDGRPVRLNGLIWDVTEHKRAEAALRENETKYRNLFENMTEEVHFWQLVRDEAGQIKTWRLVDANPPTLKTWGKSSINEIRGKTTDEIFGPGSTDHYLPVVQKIMAEGVPYAFEDYFPQLDKYFRFTSVPLGDYFITTGADITNIKKAEVALRESEERLRLLGDNLPDSAVYQYVHDPDGKVRFLYMSEGIERLNGVSTQEALQDAGALHRQILPEYYGPLVEAEKQSARELSDFEMEVPMRRSDGEVRWMLLHSRPRRLLDGSTVWDGVQIDVTERKRAETERQKLIEELQATEEELQTANEELMVQAAELQVQGEELRQSHALLEQRVKERTAEVVAANERMKYLTAQVLTAQEQERKRISMDLHDDLGQSLLVIECSSTPCSENPPQNRRSARAWRSQQGISGKLSTK